MRITACYISVTLWCLTCVLLYFYVCFSFDFRVVCVLLLRRINNDDDDDKLETVVSLSLSQLICPYLSFHCSSISQLPQWRINVMSRGRV